MHPWLIAHEDSLRVLTSLVEATSLFLVISYLYCWSPALPSLQAAPTRKRSKLTVFLFFSGVTALGTFLGTRMPGGAIANNRTVGVVLAGLIGGPSMGIMVGLTAGLHRLWLGGFTASAGAIATLTQGVLGGLVHQHLTKTPARLLDWRVAALVTALGELMHQTILLAFARPFHDSLAIVRIVWWPMVLSNTLGAALFMTVLRDRQHFFENVSAASSAFALKVAKRTMALMEKGFGREVAFEMASIIREETGVGAAAVTDRETVLAFVGLGAEHHVPGRRIHQPHTERAIATGEVVFVDGVKEHFNCSITDKCPLTSVVVVPLKIEGEVMGSVQLYEPERRPFSLMNRMLTEGIGELLSTQLVLARYIEQKNLLTVAELKLLQAQVNPHFLFNSLNTIIAITRKDPEQARELLVHLSNFFRKNLKRKSDVSTLQEELEHVGSYLEIEKARFGERLRVETEIDPTLLGLRMPTFTLQPLIENAIRHGLATHLNQGIARIRARRRDGKVLIEIEDNAGSYTPPDRDSAGLGMKIVDRRIKDILGDSYGVSVRCVPQELTCVTVTLPEQGLPAAR